MATGLAIDVRLTLGNFALHVDTDLELRGVTAVFGPSGAGKTTLLRILAGLETRAMGRVALGEEVWQDTARGIAVPAHERRIGFVFQHGRLFPHLTVAGNLRFAADRVRRRRNRRRHNDPGGRSSSGLDAHGGGGDGRDAGRDAGADGRGIPGGPGQADGRDPGGGGIAAASRGPAADGGGKDYRGDAGKSGRSGAPGPAGPDLSAVVRALDLDDLLGRSPAALSGGERQRVAMGRALLTDPRILLLDEPLSALDLRRKAEIVPYIERLAGDFGVPVLYVTHNLDEVARLASAVLLLADGRVAATGGVAEVLERVEFWPLTGRLEAGSVLEAVAGETRDGITSLDVAGETLRIPAIDIPAGRPVRLRVQARDVAVACARPERLSIRNVLPARVVSVEFAEPPYAELLLDVHGRHLRSRVTREAVAELGLRAGMRVFALIKSVAFEDRLLA